MLSPEFFIQTIRESFKGSEIVYTQGSCYKFYKILKQVFPEAKAYYNSDHVLTEIGGRFYDITGEVEKINHLLVDEHYSHEKLDKLIFDMEDITKVEKTELEWSRIFGEELRNVSEGDFSRLVNSIDDCDKRMNMACFCVRYNVVPTFKKVNENNRN